MEDPERLPHHHATADEEDDPAAMAIEDLDPLGQEDFGDTDEESANIVEEVEVGK